MKMTMRGSSFLVVVVLLLVSSSFAFVVPCNSKQSVATAKSPSLLWLSEEAGEQEPTTPPGPAVKCPNCDLCDGSGRIAGGIGAVLPWVPIKAYRPCPNFIESGGTYVRSGQPLDEIAFGRDSTFKDS